jgi:hypothetical protein
MTLDETDFEVKEARKRVNEARERGVFSMKTALRLVLQDYMARSYNEPARILYYPKTQQ